MEDIMQETLSDWLGIVYPFYCTLLYISSDTIHNVCCVSFFFLCHVSSKCKVKTSNSILTWDMEVNQSWANQPFKCSNRTRLEGGMNKLLGSEDNSFLHRAIAETRREGLLAVSCFWRVEAEWRDTKCKWGGWGVTGLCLYLFHFRVTGKDSICWLSD